MELYDELIEDIIVESDEVIILAKSDSINSLRFEPTDGEFSYSDKLATFTGKFTYTTKNEPNKEVTVDGSIKLKIAGENGINVDADENDSGLKISIDNSIIEKINSALQDIKNLKDTQIADIKVNGKTILSEKIGNINIALEQDPQSSLVYYLKVNNETVGTINIPKDQFLKSAEYDPGSNILTFTWETTNGEQVTTINLSGLIDVYTAGNGLQLTGNSFSVKLDPTTNGALSNGPDGLKLDLSRIDKELESAEHRLDSVEDSIISLEKNKQGNLIAGENITIEGNVISATGGGGGFNLADLSQYKAKLVFVSAPSQISIVESSNFCVFWDDGTYTYYKEPTTLISHEYTTTKSQRVIVIYGDFNGVISSSSYPLRALTSVEYDVNITSIPNSAFSIANSLNSIYMPGVTSVGQTAFSDCSLDEKVFDGLPNLQLINLSSFREAFGSSTNNRMKEVRFPSELYRIQSYAFGDSTPSEYSSVRIQKAIFGSHMRVQTNPTLTIEASAFRAVYIGELEFFGKATIYNGAFPRVTSVIISEYATIPTLSDTQAFNGVGNYAGQSALKNIFIDSKRLKELKQKTNWTAYADKIYPIGGIYTETITITPEEWGAEAKTAVVEVVGATSEERNVIEYTLVNEYGAEIENAYGITAESQGTMTIVFTCETVPTEDVHLFIKSTLTNY